MRWIFAVLLQVAKCSYFGYANGRALLHRHRAWPPTAVRGAFAAVRVMAAAGRMRQIKAAPCFIRRALDLFVGWTQSHWISHQMLNIQAIHNVGHRAGLLPEEQMVRDAPSQMSQVFYVQNGGRAGVKRGNESVSEPTCVYRALNI